MRRSGLFTAILVLLAAAAHAAPDSLLRLADPATAPYRITARGHVTDASHPMHPGDFRKEEVRLRIDVIPETGEAIVEFESGEGSDSIVNRYFVRRGRIFQVNDSRREVAAGPLGDLSAAAVAAIHPRLAAEAVRERREDLRAIPGSHDYWFAWNDALWRVGLDLEAGCVTSLSRLLYREREGDGAEEIRYEEWRKEGAGDGPARVVVTRDSREVARFEFAPAGSATPADSLRIPAGEGSRDRDHTVRAADLEFKQAAPGVFYLDLDSLDTRVFVAEFADHLAVIEGAWSGRVCDAIAEAARRRFGKPVRWFAFSHLHGQYIGGVRSWVHEGAAVLAPPTTVPLVEEMAKSRHVLRPDAQELDPRPLTIEAVADRRHLEDAANALDIYNVKSGHTDEYLIFHFPRQRLLLAGDLFFYRPGRQLSDRARQLCQTVQSLGLEVNTLMATWPLHGYGTKSIVPGAEMREACGTGE